MKISIIGTGYVGLVTGACFAHLGNKVICCDVIKEKVDLINKGISPIYEPVLEEILKKNLKNGNLRVTTDIKKAINETEISFICVGTPSKQDGSIDLKYIESASKTIGQSIKKGHVVVTKSTVVPGTTDSVVIPAIEKQSKMKLGEWSAAMNPEFLREGSAVQDFLNPDRIVFGVSDKNAEKKLNKLYENFKCKKLVTDLRTAEMIKYASNCFLATKISFINEIANMCQLLNIDVTNVVKGMELDNRISPKFLRAGAGFGGSCFPKDVKALVAQAKSLGYDPKLLDSALEVNEEQAMIMLKLLKKELPDVKNKKITVLGLAFKPNSDDIREAASIKIIRELLMIGAKISTYDPKAMDHTKKIFPQINYHLNAIEALKGADACLLVTEWDEFAKLQPDDFKKHMKKPILIDGRLLYDPNKMIKKGIKFRGIGRQK